MNKYSLIAIKCSLFSLVLIIAIAVLSLEMSDKNAYIIFTIIGLLAFAIILLSFIGFLQFLKSFKEPKKFQMLFGITINLFFLFLYSYLIPS